MATYMQVNGRGGPDSKEFYTFKFLLRCQLWTFRCLYCVVMAGIQTQDIPNTRWFHNHKHFVFILEYVSLYILFALKSECSNNLSIKLMLIQATIIKHWSGTYSRCRERLKTQYLPILQQEKSTKYNGHPHNQIGLPYVIITVSKY